MLVTDWLFLAILCFAFIQITLAYYQRKFNQAIIMMSEHLHREIIEIRQELKELKEEKACK